MIIQEKIYNLFVKWYKLKGCHPVKRKVIEYIKQDYSVRNPNELQLRENTNFIIDLGDRIRELDLNLYPERT